MDEIRDFGGCKLPNNDPHDPKFAPKRQKTKKKRHRNTVLSKDGVGDDLGGGEGREEGVGQEVVGGGGGGGVEEKE